MKLLIILLGMATAGLLGYVMEPGLRLQLTGIAPKGDSAKSLEDQVKDLVPSSGPAIDPSTLTAEQLPEKVTLSTDIKFADESSGLSMTVSSGSQVKLVRVQGTDVVVRPGDTPYSIVLPISKTNLMELLAANPPKTEPTPEPAPVPVPDPTPQPEPAPPVEPAPAPAGDSEEPAPVPAPVTDPKPEPAAEPAPAADPAPAAEPAPAPASGPVDVVKVMQESIKGGQVKEFTFDQVLDWKAGASETVDGESYQTGLVSYKAETIFGVKTIQAKALIKDGKAQRWIWPKSGMEIK